MKFQGFKGNYTKENLDERSEIIIKLLKMGFNF